MGEFTRIERQGRVATVYFDRHEKLNALSVAAMHELTQVARSFEDDIETSVIVLTGTETFFPQVLILRTRNLRAGNQKGFSRAVIY